MIRFLQGQTRAMKIFVGAILLFFSFLLVITLVPGGLLGDPFSGGGRGTLAKVGDHEISTADVQQLARNMARQQRLPEQFLPFMVQQAAEQKLVQESMLYEAERLGMKVSDAELAESLQKEYAQPLFADGKVPTREEYEDFVAQQYNMGVTQFEGELKKELMLRKLRGAVGGGAIVTEDEVRKEFQRKNSKVKIEYALLSSETLGKQIKITDPELRSFYEANKARYANSIPEKRRLRYALVQISDAYQQAKAQVRPEDLRSYYDQHKTEFAVSDRAKVSHILIRTPAPGADGKVDQKAVEQARQKAEAILKQLRGGAKFEDVAKKESQDPGSAKEGGSLGWIERGRTVPEFERAAFSQPVGKIGDLVKSSYGFHIIRVDAKEEAHQKSLDEAKDQILIALSKDRAQSLADAAANKLANQARTSGLEKAAAENHAKLYTTDLVARTDAVPELGSAPELMDAAFAATKGGPPASVKLAQGYAVFEVTEIKPAATPAFEEIRARVETEFKAERAQQVLGQKTQELADRAHVLHDLKKAAQEAGADLKTSDLVGPESQVPDLGSMGGPAGVAFDMKVGEISTAIPLGARGVVFAVLEKAEAAPEEFAQQKEQIRERLLQRKRSERVGNFALSLRQRLEKEGKLRINQDEWNRVVKVRGNGGVG